MNGRTIALALLVLLGAVVGAAIAGNEGALLGGVAGLLALWANRRRAWWNALRGAAIGAAFLFLVGPLADSLLSRTPLTERVLQAVVAGALVGAALGIKNARAPKES